MIVSLASRKPRLMSLIDARHVDHDRAVDAPQQRQDLVDVARRDHLGHLDARRREQDVDARRVAPQDVGQVRLGDPVGRQVEDRRGVDLGTFSSARRSPNWTLPSMSTVRCSSWAMATARLNAMVVLPTPPFGANTEMIARRPDRRCQFVVGLADAGDQVHELEARRTASTARRGRPWPDRPRSGSAGP